MHIEDHAQIIFFAPADKIVQNIENFSAIAVRAFLQNDLIKAKPYVIHAEGGDISDVIFCDIAFEMLHITDGDLHSAVLAQNVKAFVISKPAANTHAALKTVDLFHAVFSLFHAEFSFFHYSILRYERQ